MLDTATILAAHIIVVRFLNRRTWYGIEKTNEANISYTVVMFPTKVQAEAFISGMCYASGGDVMGHRYNYRIEKKAKA